MTKNVLYAESMTGETIFSAESFGNEGWRFCERGRLPIRGDGLHVIQWLADMISGGKVRGIRDINRVYFQIDGLGGTIDFYPNRYVPFSVWANELFAPKSDDHDNVTEVTEKKA